MLSLIACILLPLETTCMKRGAEAEESDRHLAPPHKRVASTAATSASDIEEEATSTSLPRVIRGHRFARATLDTSFKHMLMGDEDRAPLLSFLTAFTGINVTSVTHYPTAFPVLRKDTEEKQTFLDLACHDDKGHYFLVEVQVKEQKYWNPRALYYAAGIYSAQLAPGAPWKALEPVIGLNILDHDRETLPDGDFKRDFQFLDRDHLGELKEGVDMKDPAQIPYLRIIQCELPRANLNIMPNCPLRQWLQLLRESGTLTEIPAGVEEPVRKAYERLEFAKWGSELIGDYTKDALHLEEYEDVIERNRLKGKEEGFLEGKTEGALEGKKEIAREMLSEGISIDTIMKITKLSEAEIRNLT